MDVFQLIGRLALAKEGATMGQKEIASATQGIMGRAEGRYHGGLRMQLGTLYTARKHLQRALHNIDLAERAMNDILDAETRDQNDREDGSEEA